MYKGSMGASGEVLLLGLFILADTGIVHQPLPDSWSAM